MKYRCIKRLSTDGGKTVHEVGEIVELSEADAQSALRQGAVVPVEQPNIEELKRERAELDAEIAAAEQAAAAGKPSDTTAQQPQSTEKAQQPDGAKS